MGRPLRIQAPNTLFHVINRGNGRQRVFCSPRDYREYLDLIARYKEKFDIRLYHFVLMTNHVHLLLEAVHADGALSGFMQGLTLAHTRRFNARHKSVGHAWQGRYTSILIDRDEYFLQCGRYIELNPVRAKMVRHPSEYPWSSYSAHATGTPNAVVDTHPMYDDLGKTPQVRQRRYQADTERELIATRKQRAQRFSVEQVYGSDTFLQRAQHEFGLSPFHRGPGRPRGNQT